MKLVTEQFGIIGTWSNDGFDGETDLGVIRWVTDYQENSDLRLEAERAASRARRLEKKFGERDLPGPFVGINDGLDALSPKILKVYVAYMPVVEEYMLRPIVELRVPPMTNEQVKDALVRRAIDLGARSIRDVYL